MSAEPPDVRPGKRIASVFLLPDCDMACTFCASERGFDVMTYDEADALLTALASTAIESVVLGGGEPLLWPHGIDRLAARASELGFVVQVCTNGGAPIRPFDLPHVDRIILPLESTVAATHDDLRRRAGGHHAGVVERIESLLAGGRELTLSTVVTAGNIEHLPAIAAYLDGLARAGGRLHAWHLYRFLPVGRGGAANAPALEVTAAAFSAACERAKSLPLPFPVYRRDDMLRSSSVEFFWREDGRLRTSAQAVDQASR